MCSAISSSVLHFAKRDIVFGALESRAYGVFAICCFRTIQAAAGKQSGKLGERQAKKLFGEDVIDPRLAVGDALFHPFIQPFGNLTQEYSGFAGWIKGGSFLIVPKALWQGIQHLVYQFGRGKDLVTAKVGDT